jgi:hypothetical protein
MVIGACELRFVKDYEIVALIFFDLRALVLFAAVLYRELMKVELLCKLKEILARGVCDIGPDDFVLVQANLADVGCRNLFRKLFGDAIETDGRNHFKTSSARIYLPAKYNAL